jgi:magnesium transporter
LSADAAQGSQQNSTLVFTVLLEAMVDYGADRLEQIGSALGLVSQRIFGAPGQVPPKRRNLTRAMHHHLITIGQVGEQLSRIRESLLGLGRIVSFVADTAADWLAPELRVRLRTARHDLASLTDFESHLSGKTQFLQDATLGLINTEQNDIFKVLTIVSVVGVPPTLIASIYGMNFEGMPELHWHYGYAFGLSLILLSTLMPILWFKWRRWW